MKPAPFKSSPFLSASLLILLSVITTSIVMLYVGLAPTDDFSQDENFAAAMLIVGVIIRVVIFAFFGSAVGLVLSVVSLARKEGKRKLAVLSFILNGAIVVLGCVIFYRNFEFR